MKRILFSLAIAANMLFAACTAKTDKQNTDKMSVIKPETIATSISNLETMHPDANATMIARCVENAAKFWTAEDGSQDEFITFCKANYIADKTARHELYMTMDRNLAILNGNYNQISLGLKRPLHVRGSEIKPIDEVFGAFDPFAHFTDDMYNSKIAFTILLNFPFYTLDEKNTLGKEWSREEWAYARLGDLFSARIPATVTQEFAAESSAADSYIANYNIMMGKLRNEKGEQLFADDMMLISHWGLRDELKSNYANTDGKGLEKQRMIYTVMKHIVNQTIPSQVISNGEYVWSPVANTITKDGKEVAVIEENLERYEVMRKVAKANMAMDKYCPTYSTSIERAFNQQMEVSAEEIEKLFVEFISSPEVKATAELIKNRLGRDLEPFDIWYDGFKNRSNLNEDELSKTLMERYPNAEAFKADLPNIMVRMGFTREKADAVCAKIKVDASRGAGHAWPGMSKDDFTYLRSRISDKGMDYKGYNIGIHEFGHNVEQVISMNDVDFYTMSAVPSTAFTEAIAFVFQSRDLKLMGIDNVDANAKAYSTLDMFWGCYEIMGVSLVDIYTWQWLYENPNATAEQLKAQIITNAKTVWNKYYEPVLGCKDSPILGIYSHMIKLPLYLPNYPYGSIVESQLEEQFVGKNVADEIIRIYPNGKLTPNLWMQVAAEQNVSTAPLLKHTAAAIESLK